MLYPIQITLSDQGGRSSTGITFSATWDNRPHPVILAMHQVNNYRQVEVE